MMLQKVFKMILSDMENIEGVEVILVGLNVSIEGNQCHVSAEAGIADRNSRLLLMLDATIELP